MSDEKWRTAGEDARMVRLVALQDAIGAVLAFDAHVINAAQCAALEEAERVAAQLRSLT